MAYQVKILKHSVGVNGIPIISSELTYPRFIHSEFMTHRTLSRNSASSRAIPVNKLIEQIKNDPVIPIWWGKNQAGMKADEEIDATSQEIAQIEWLKARDKILDTVNLLSNEHKMHKQIVNRLLEPWMWITVICTATEYDNFFALRDHKDAQPEIKHLASMWKDAINNSTPTQLKPGKWHLPLVDDYENLINENFTIDQIVRISVGRCARVSYLTHSGKRDPNADILLADRLQQDGHMSPFEHPAQCVGADDDKWYGNIRGWLQCRKTIKGEDVFGK